MELRIREEQPGDRAEIEALLIANGLPIPSPDDTPVRFLVASSGDGRVRGTCGWESAGDEVLLRSVAVAIELRGRGLGARLVGEALRRLDEEGHPRVTLVTMDAHGFFARFAFAEVERNTLPEAIRRTRIHGLHECVGGHWMVRRNGERRGPSSCDAP